MLLPFRNIILLSVLLFLVFSCNTATDNQPERPVFKLQENSGIHFTNSVQNTKDFNIFSYRNFYNGGGVAIGDINNDGLPDIYFTANQGSNKLYLNKGHFQFEDITSGAGVADSTDWSTGVVMVDINHDGWLDIYVCNAGYIDGKAPESKLFINNHDNTFTDSAAAYGLENKGGYATHAAFFDYDNDGDLDCFIINNSFIPTNTLNYENKRNLRAKDWPVKDFLKGGGDRLLRNDNGHFTDVSENAGIYGSLISFGLGVTVGDVNNDGWPDVYVSNDFFERDYLYINQHDGTFHDELEKYIQHTSHSSMGADMCDVNNDGYPDIFTTEMLPDDDYRLKTTSSFENIDVNRQKIRSGFYHQYMQNTLQVNNGKGKFMESAWYSGVAASDWSWGGLIFDADNNSYPDIFISNGIYKDVTDQDFIDFFADEVYQKMALSGEKTDVDQIINRMPSNPLVNKMFANRDGIHFTDRAKEWGMSTPSFSNGAAYGDLDNDGDLDLVVNNVNQPAFVYKNNSREQNPESSHYIGIKLRSAAPNTFAIGSKVKIFTGKSILCRELIPSRGFQSSVDYKIIVGLGSTSRIDSMQVIWPDRTFEVIKDLPADTVLVLTHDHKCPLYDFSAISPKPIFDTVSTVFDKHKEDDYVDFYNERNIPSMLSHEGPRAAVADVNGDGLEDVFICGATMQPGQLYLQNKDGSFTKKQISAFEKDAASEDICALFFDADKDGDLDLFVGSGGNNHVVNSPEFNNRLYINDGHGNFTESPFPLPQTGMNTACVAASDIDGDGDIDLFIGSRSVPNSYGEDPASMVLINDGKGHFRDDTKNLFPGLYKPGMVTSAVFCNIFSKEKKDLVIVGEWMAPRIFTYNGKEFIEQQTDLSDKFGWWQTVYAADLDGDGHDDLVLGNMGQNFYLQPDSVHPVKLWINDFDNNGTKDKVLSRTVNNRDVPVFSKKEITEQMPSLKKQNLKHAEYAKKSIQELFSAALIKSSQVKQFTYSASCVALNKGNGKFLLRPLPWYAQLSCLNVVLATDLNGDGKPDLLIGSNKFDFLPQFGRLDAAYGLVLINDGHGNFNWVSNTMGSLNINGCVRDIQSVMINGQKNYLWLRNDDFPLMMKPASGDKFFKN